MQIPYSDWRHVAKRVRTRFPQAGDHLRRLDKLFEAYDKDQSGTLDFGELSELLKQIDSKLTSLPATAQRANQLRRGARIRLTAADGRHLPHKLERAAMEEVRQQLVQYTVPRTPAPK